MLMKEKEKKYNLVSLNFSNEKKIC